MMRVFFLSILVFLITRGDLVALDFFSEEVPSSPTEEESAPVQSPPSRAPVTPRETLPGPDANALTPSELEAYRSQYLSTVRAVQQGGLPRRLIYVYAIGEEDARLEEALIAATRRDASLNISAFAVIDCNRPDHLRALTESALRRGGIDVFLDCQNSILASYGISELPALVIDGPTGRPVVLTGARISEGLP